MSRDCSLRRDNSQTSKDYRFTEACFNFTGLSGKDVRTMPQPGRFEDFRGIIPPLSQDNRESHLKDYLAIYQMLNHMRQPLASKRAIAALESPKVPQPVCEPLVSFIDKAFSDSELPIHVQLVFGIGMLLSSYKA